MQLNEWLVSEIRWRLCYNRSPCVWWPRAWRGGFVAKSCLTLAAPWTAAHAAPLFMGFPGWNTGVGCYFLLQGIFPTQGLNPALLHCRQILNQLSHQGSPQILNIGSQNYMAYFSQLQELSHSLFSSMCIVLILSSTI